MIIDFLKERKNVFQIIVVSIILAFGVRFIGQGLLEIFEFRGIENIYIGLFFVFFVALFFGYNLYKQKKKTYTIQGFVIYNKTSNRIVEIPDYKFGRKVKKYFDSSFAESKGLEKIWEKYKIHDYMAPKDVTTGKDLLCQATEYFFISSLSKHLTTYFYSKEFKQKKLNKLTRNDIPHTLLENSFLDLFSKSMDKREAFIDSFKGEPKAFNIIHVSTETDGHLFENFNLILPKGCKISKTSKDTLRIKTNRIELTITNEITGWTTEVPQNFIQYYIGESSDSEYIKYIIETKISVTFSFLAFFTNLGWSYFKWIDSFIDVYHGSVSEKAFLNRINWNSINNLIMAAKRFSK